MGLILARSEVWAVIFRAYEAGYFGPPAKPDDPIAVQLLADQKNLLHLATGGESGRNRMPDARRTELVGLLEELFNNELHFTVADPHVSFNPPSGINWE